MDLSVMKKIWLGICEPQNGNISKVRNLMYAVVPQGQEFAFTVPLVCRSVENYWRKQFAMVKPEVIILNDDAALFGSFENYNVFLQCCQYIADMNLDNLFVVNQHYEKKIYRDNDFEWYTPATVWEKEARNAELRKEAEASLAAKAAEKKRVQEQDERLLEELRCLKSMK